MSSSEHGGKRPGSADTADSDVDKHSLHGIAISLHEACRRMAAGLTQSDMLWVESRDAWKELFADSDALMADLSSNEGARIIDEIAKKVRDNPVALSTRTHQRPLDHESIKAAVIAGIPAIFELLTENFPHPQEPNETADGTTAAEDAQAAIEMAQKLEAELKAESEITVRLDAKPPKSQGRRGTYHDAG